MYTRTVTVMPSDVSCGGVIKLRSLLDYFQDTAALAVENIEGTTTELLARGYAWVLIRYEIDFTGSLPALDESFRINTFHDPKHGYNTLRVFQVYAEDDTLIASAKTSWLLVDTKSGRPVKPTAHIPEISARDNEDIPPNFTDIPSIVNVTHRAEFPVMFHDTDYNGHVNNAAYFAWVHDSSPVDVMSRKLKSVCASFRSGARPGEKISLDFSQNGDMTLCRVMRPGMNKPCASFMLLWQEASPNA